ncbi:MAG TPA: M56 family metallopeptidase [Pyrinomonadaceae bacterium]|nr:M56 family metallopeptidase [Pyrinomonadaceae bacterium]
MKTSSQLLLTLLLNAVWQIALIAALASLGAWLLRRSAMRYQHWLWVAALGLSLLVPAVTAVRSLQSEQLLTTDSFLRAEPHSQRELVNPVLTRGALPFQSPSTESASDWSLQLNSTLALILLLVYAALLLFRLFRLIQAWLATRKVRQAAVLWERNDAVAAITRECAKRINLESDRLAVCSSATVAVPITLGLFRPVIILPESLLRDGDTDLLTSAIGHELIHVARRDYVLNFIYELLFLPVSFHPLAALVRNRIKQTRELCCDELVAERILNAQVYARSLVALAGSAPPLRRLSVSTTVGIADADILEARIMSLLTKPNLNRRWKRLLLLAVSLLLLIPSIAAAAFAMRFEVAPAQDPAPQEQELEAKHKTDAVNRESRTAVDLKERMARDPQFREEVQRRREVEMEMRAIRQAALVRLSRLTMDQAIQIATSQFPGKVLECNLDADKWEEPGKLAKDGVVFYRVVVADEANPGGATHVWVNAVDGSVIKGEKELPRKMRSPANQ